MADAAETLFAQFLEGDKANLQRIEQAITDKEPEGLMLDYKRNADGKGISVSKPTTHSKDHLGRLISAFANMNGGLIIWGVDAKDGKPFKASPIPDINVFVQYINTLTAGATEPMVKGVRTVGVGDGSGAAGYAVTYIPRSFEAPHQALRGEFHNYWMRSGASCEVMEHRFIRALFAERARPALEVVIGNPFSGTSPNGQWALLVWVAIANNGDTIARYPALIYATVEGISVSGPTTQEIETIPCAVKGVIGRQVVIHERLLYPGTETVVCHFALIHKNRLENIKPFTIRVVAICDGFTGDEITKEITEEMLVAAADPNLVMLPRINR